MFGARHRQQRHPLLSAHLDAGTQTACTGQVGGFCCGETSDNVIELRREVRPSEVRQCKQRIPEVRSYGLSYLPRIPVADASSEEVEMLLVGH